MQRLTRFVPAFLLFACLLPATVRAQDPATVRFYQGVTAYVANPDGKAFDVTIDVRDWNLMENGPREMLLKIYEPDGHVIERKVVEDDGVVGHAFLPEAGGWDHEMWYHLLNYGRGSVPMIAWSSLTSSERLAAMRPRTFTFNIDKPKKGVYRVMMMGSRDHVATLSVSNDLKFGLAGHPMWMHGHDDLFETAYVYVPKGTTGIDLGFAEYDQPVTRRFTIVGPDAAVLYDGPATGGFQSRNIKLEAGKYDDKIITVKVAKGEGDYMIHMLLGRDDVRKYRGWGGAPAIFAPDAETAKALNGGAIYHDGEVFWHGFQVRFHDWLKANRTEADYIVKDKDGKVIEPSEGPKYGWNTPSVVYKGLPKANKPFYALNGQHEAPPVCDTLMHDYPAHKNPHVLNIAMRDMHEGLRMLTVGDMPVINRWSGNLGYVFGTYGWHYWRPAWRIRQLSDAPEAVKDIINEAFILAGDRLAFARGIERTNGNAMSHVPMALRYCYEVTHDPLQKQLADVYLERFATGGWGRGAGISKSGDCQEHFAHDFHYGTYIFANYRAITFDLDAPKFDAIRNRIAELYSYLYCPGSNAYPWNSRTAQGAGLGSGTGWKGNPGDDFTVSVNDGDEWFAARRPNYYILTFHGRLAPEWLNHYFGTKMGYGGGIMCQVTVPGYGPVIASTPAGKYGKGMERYNWRNFHIHSIVGQMDTGEPFVGADGEHTNAKLVENRVIGSGEVRYAPAHVTRSYRFEDSYITVEARVDDTAYRAGYQGRGHRPVMTELYEMVPFVAGAKGKPTKVIAYDESSEAIGPVTDKPVQAAAVVIDRGGFGVQLVFTEPRNVKLGVDDTVLIELIQAKTNIDGLTFSYNVVPYTGEPVIGEGAIKKEEHPLAKLDAIASSDAVAAALAAVEPKAIVNREGEVAQVRVAVAGDDLAVHAMVNDERVRQTSPPWKGSSFEIFCSPVGSQDIAQVFLLPAEGDKPAVGLKAARPSPVKVEAIRVTSKPVKGGYEVSALVPLSQLGIDPEAGQTTLEFQVGAVKKGKLTHTTMFPSRFAYQNSSRYGLFVIGGAANTDE